MEKTINNSKCENVREIKADLILLHAPSVYDFRKRDDIVFASSDTDGVDVTSIYEIYPMGLLSIRQYLNGKGMKAEVINIAALMLSRPDLDVDRLLSRLKAPVFGIDLHWMIHCQGSIELAKRIREIHPDSKIIFGGITATYYADELIKYSCVDVVVKGYDTLRPIELFVKEVISGGDDLSSIPNLVYKDQKGEIHETDFSHKPMNDFNDVAIDWSGYIDASENVTMSRSIMTLNNTGCAFECPKCGGARSAYRKYMGVEKTLISKNLDRVYEELSSIGKAARTTSVYALQSYSESNERMGRMLDMIRELGFKSLHFEQYYLTDDELLKKMVGASQIYINLSPESHDPVISKLSGRGNYTMEEMEEWIPRALDAGVRGIMVWFLIGLPRQTKDSVRETVDYCEKLLKKFNADRVLPVICPMVPFLDPRSRFFEEPEKHGYRIFHRSLEEHRQASVDPVWYRRFNYETDWMTRKDIQDITFEAISRLAEIKGELGILPVSICNSIRAMVSETAELLNEVEKAIELDGQLGKDLRRAIRNYNRKVLSFSNDQISPIPRPFGSRWFDDFTVKDEMLADLCDASSSS